MDDATRAAASCPLCGQPLPADARDGLCPACLMAAGLETLTGGSADSAVTVAGRGTADARDEGPRLQPGQAWGPYRIGRLLGRGGMGEVYEAEHTESGRRLALKVLRSRLRNVEDRARFLREGQLAASISHPHTVYIFGSEEIAGMPVISMELLPGGTLKDRVVSRGPLPPAEAVDAVLEIVGGLDAAHAAGILHRDIKPSNCFVDSDGTVKVGDFGLSISTLARDVRHELATSGFEGTPQFAAPEQLRGEPLDVRADIYAVGATLYYLLTGQPPFDAPDLRQLVERVTKEPPSSPRRLRREIPPGLAAVVLKCLATRPADRPGSYAALADLLRPFAWHEESPAGLGVRLFANLVDLVILLPVGGLWTGAQMAMVGVAPSGAWNWTMNALYFLVFEGLWGASPGKRLLRLAVTSGGARATWTQIAVRTGFFYLPSLIVALVVEAGMPERIVVVGSENSGVTIDANGIALTLTLMFFLTARRANGRAALHDLASGTRVVVRAARVRVPDSAAGAVTEPAESTRPSATGKYGPFAGITEVGATDQGRLVIGFDPVLRRRVWIHVVPPGTPPTDAARRDVGRAARLHWLTGKRSADENWDAFEAPDGVALLDSGSAQMRLADGRAGMSGSTARWPVVKHWLLDLANELAEATTDGSLPRLGLDRLWLRADGRILLLDFSTPTRVDTPQIEDREPETASTVLAPTALLASVAAFGLRPPPGARHDPSSLPLSARGLVASWSSATAPSLDDTRIALQRVAAAPDRVTRWRAVPSAMAAAPVATLFLVGLLLLPLLFNFLASEDGEAASWLAALADATPDADSPLKDPVMRDAAERYVAGRFGARLASDAYWSTLTMQGNQSDLRPTADAVLARHPAVSPEQLAEVSALLAPEIERRRGNAQELGDVAGPVVACLAALGTLFALVCCLVSAAAVPGGVGMRALGLAVVRRDGAEIGRGRSLLRVLIAWSPALAWFVYLAQSPKIQGFVPNPPAPIASTLLVLGLMTLGAAWTLWRPGRGPHDLLAGTWVVPR